MESQYNNNMVVSKQAKNLADVLFLILRKHSAGFAVLLGKHPWPSIEDIYHMMGSNYSELNTRVQGGVQTPEQQRIVEKVEWFMDTVKKAGGPEAIIERFKDLHDKDIDVWIFLRDSTLALGWMGNIFKKAALKDVAEKYHIHPRTLKRRRTQIILSIAGEILYGAY